MYGDVNGVAKKSMPDRTVTAYGCTLPTKYFYTNLTMVYKSLYSNHDVKNLYYILEKHSNEIVWIDYGYRYKN